jgi:hypothetical protein
LQEQLIHLEAVTRDLAPSKSKLSAAAPSAVSSN